ncbi:MAG: hypothetical protein JSR77_09715 [Planctomycetes bacterium]|nr:hypothetical protein [Planctomycetota bacterium]
MENTSAIIPMVVGLLTAPAVSQPTTPDAPPIAADAQPPTGGDLEIKPWSFSLSASTYMVPDDREYIQPTFTADHDWLHLEARYNYEAVETGSLWAGYNFSGGEQFKWQITPMLGGVFGETDGIAPGYEATLSWWKLELYSEGEYVIDLNNSAESFFYNWSELTLSPVEWFRFGLVGQRTRLYDSDRDIQRGFLVGFTVDKVDICGYVLDPDDDNPTFVLTVELSF